MEASAKVAVYSVTNDGPEWGEAAKDAADISCTETVDGSLSMSTGGATSLCALLSLDGPHR